MCSAKLLIGAVVVSWTAVYLDGFTTDGTFEPRHPMRGPPIRRFASPFFLPASSTSDDETIITSCGEQEESTSYDFTADYTGIVRVIDWTPVASAAVPLHAEKGLLQTGVLVRRGEFSVLPEGSRRLDEIRKQCERYEVTLEQALFMRQQLMVSHVVSSIWKVEKYLDKIQRQFGTQQKDILEMSHALNLPPVSIVRAVVQSRVDKAHPHWRARDRKRLVKEIIHDDSHYSSDEFLSSREWEQLQIAKASDVVGYQEERNDDGAREWEEALHAFLEEHNINYVTEDELRQAGAPRTPDCLLLDDCTFNGRKVRWIDSKSFYGSGLKQNGYFVKSLKKQIASYEAAFGETGAVIFKHGFSQDLSSRLPDTLFLDAGPLESID